MTVYSPSNDPKIHNGNDVATSFSFPFKTDTDTQVKVVYRSADGTENTLTLNSDYTVTGYAVEGSGIVTYPISGDPLPTGASLAISPAMDFLQKTDIKNQKRFAPELHESAFDTLMLHIKELRGLINRSLQFKISSGLSGAEFGEDPEEDMLIAWDGATGKTKNVSGLSGTVASTSFWKSILLKSNTSESKDSLGIIKSVKDYGALGNGTIDDTVAIQAAIDAVDTVVTKASAKYIINSGIVYFPAGHYRVSDAITIPAGIKIVGEGRGCVLIDHQPSSAKNCFYFVDDVDYGNSISSEISNLSIKGDGSYSQYGIAGENLSFNCFIEKVGVFGCYDGIHLEGAVTTTIRDSTSSDNTQYGLYLGNPSVANVKNNRFEDNEVGCYITNVASFAFVGGMKYTHNVHQRNELEGLKIENWTDGIIEDCDFEGNNESDTADTAYLDITGRFNPFLNISVKIANNRFYEDDSSADSIPIKITDIKNLICEYNTFEGEFKQGITIAGIQPSTYADGVDRGDYTPSFTNNVLQRRIDGSTVPTLNFFGAPTKQLRQTEPGLDFAGGTADNARGAAAMTLNTHLSVMTPKFLVPDAAPADYQGIIGVSDRFTEIYNANSFLIRINSSASGGGLDFMLWDATNTLFLATLYDDFIEDFGGKFVRVAITIDRSTTPATLKGYINDVCVYENQSANWATDLAPDYFFIGIGQSTTRTYLGTMIGGAYIFKSALSQDDINDFYNNNEQWASYTTAPELYAPMDEYSATTITDQSGNGYNSTMLNNVTWNSEYQRNIN